MNVTTEMKRELTAMLSDAEAFIQERFGIAVHLLAKDTATGKLVAPYTDDAWEQLKQAVADYYNTDWNTIINEGRKKPYPEIRACFCYIGSTHLPYKTLHQIANMIGGKDHTTVIHSRETFRGYLNTNDPKATEAFQHILSAIKETSNHALKTH